MALRLIEVVLPEKDGGKVGELLKERAVLAHRQGRLADGEAGADSAGRRKGRAGAGSNPAVAKGLI
jgi:hypothetical protein